MPSQTDRKPEEQTVLISDIKEQIEQAYRIGLESTWQSGINYLAVCYGIDPADILGKR